jgi:hypothetical protein
MIKQEELCANSAPTIQEETQKVNSILPVLAWPPSPPIRDCHFMSRRFSICAFEATCCIVDSMYIITCAQQGLWMSTFRRSHFGIHDNALCHKRQIESQEKEKANAIDLS